MDGTRQPRRRTRMLAALAVAAAVGAGTGVGAYALTADSPGSATENLTPGEVVRHRGQGAFDGSFPDVPPQCVQVSHSG